MPRFDEGVRRMTVVLFMLGYGLVTIPSVLYSGSIAVLKLFDVPELLQLDYGTSLVLTIMVIGALGASYAILGGLRAVAVSDTLNGVGLLIVGVAVPWLGLRVLGEGSVGAGLNIMLSTDTHKLNAIGGPTDPTPFATLFTGMVFANLFYWCTNQYVIQRTLAARSLAEGQKGVLLSGFFKVLVPLLMMIPGVVAYHLYGPELQSIDLAYPQLVRDVLPVYATGFFLAVLLGAVLSSFNSLINSASTLFCTRMRYFSFQLLEGLAGRMSYRLAPHRKPMSRPRSLECCACSMPRTGSATERSGGVSRPSWRRHAPTLSPSAARHAVRNSGFHRGSAVCTTARAGSAKPRVSAAAPSAFGRSRRRSELQWSQLEANWTLEPQCTRERCGACGWDES